jgi:hypothetical protein
MATQTRDWLDALVSTTRAVRAVDLDGEDCGTFRAIRDCHGHLGWQATDDARGGALLGILDRFGVYDDPTAAGNRTWELCKVTAGHVRALRRADGLVWGPVR